MPVYLPGMTFGGLGYGGAAHGYSPYGSGVYSPPPVSDGGYGGAPYGYASYGSVDITPPRVAGAMALDGYRVEIFFNEAMADTPDLVSPANYSFAETYGVALTPVSVEVGTASGLGYSSVIVTHSGSTLGGQYTVTVTGVTDVAGNLVGPPPTNSAVFYALGDDALVGVSLPSPDDGRTVVLDFTSSTRLGVPQALLPESSFSPGVDSTDSYEITTDYPVAPTLGSAAQDAVTLSRVVLDVHPMTSATYDLKVGPSRAFAYDGSLLPDDDPQLAGASVGTGTSSASPTGLFLSKGAGVEYGWSFGDTTGRMTLGTTFRADLEYSLDAASVVPAVLNTTLGTFSVSDGSVQVDISLSDSGGVKIITVVSGAYSTSVLASWDTAGDHCVTLIRNQKGDFYTLLLDGVPLTTFASASATGVPTYGAGTAFVLSPAHAVSLFRVSGMGLTSSLTLFTSTWNFVHDLGTTFVGSAVLTRDRLKTKYGPLVRGWGDATPATTQDVEVRLDGGSVDLAGVNPYVGEIYPAIPIPLAAVGVISVEVDYIWFANPAMEMTGLNTRGLSLNTWDRAVGTTPKSPSPLPVDALGAVPTHRFPMGVALAPFKRKSPKRIGHKYYGWQNDYSALTNSPTSLLLNQNPHSVSSGGLSAASLSQSGAFRGQSSPVSAESPWILSGVDEGGVVGDGTYEVVDASSGPYGVGTAAIYSRDGDFSLDIALTMSARLRAGEYTADGVFTGVGLGMHDGNHLVVVGLLNIDGVQHVGLLLDGTKPHLEEGWQVGPSSPVEALTPTVIRVPFESFLSGFSAGDRFRVAGGPQKGVYTVAACGVDLDADGDVLLTLSEPLPVDPALFGADRFTVFYETPWDTNLISFRIYADFPAGSAQVFLGGSLSGMVADAAEIAPFPAQTSLLFPATEKGVYFWGSLSRRAVSKSYWDLVQYLGTPARMTETVQGITALTEMDVIPPEDPNDPWYLVGGFGTGRVDSSGDTLLLKATSDGGIIPTQFYYERVEPYLTPKVRLDSEATFKVETHVLGAGSASLRARDTAREAAVTTLLIRSDGVVNTLVEPRPHTTVSGLLSLSSAGWLTSGSPPAPFVRGQTLEWQKDSTDTGYWSQTAAVAGGATDVGLIIEGRFSVGSYTAGSVGIGFFLGALVRDLLPGNARFVSLVPSAGAIDLVDSAQAVVQSFPFDWDDGAFHEYRVVCDPVADLVIVSVDDQVLGSAAFSAFVPEILGGNLNHRARIGFLGTGACSVTLDSASFVPARIEAAAGETLTRTFGVLLRGGDPQDLDSYRIARNDPGSPFPNSDPGAGIEDMDWRDFCRVRLFMDPTWGVSVYRPDLPLPPTATGDFATETTDPSAAWINVEYRDLPDLKTVRGTVAFGSLNLHSVTQQRWDSVRYRVRGAPDGFGIAPQGMVLNRAFALTSGEYNLDRTPETATITSRTPYLVNIFDGDMHADRVFVVQVDGLVISPTLYTFNKDTQNLQFVSTAPLPSAEHPVTVTFAIAQPVTATYLCQQPINETVTVLNADTPPVPSHRDQPPAREVLPGTAVVDPDDVLDPSEALADSDPHQVVTFTDTEDSLYSDLHFCTEEEGDDVHITTICDGPGPGLGLAEIAVEGDFTTDNHTVPEGPAGPWKGSPAIRGSATHFNQSSVFTAGGGFVLGGRLGTSVLYANQRGPSGNVPATGMGLNQDFAMRLEDTQPRTEDLSGLLSDNTPPTSGDPTTDPNPDNPGAGGANGNGAAAYVLTDYAGVTASRLGPWGGLSALQANSVLAGGSPLNGSEFTLEGGQAVAGPTVTTGYMQAAN